MPPFDKAAEYDRLRAAGKTHEEAIAGAIQAEKAAQYDLLRSKGLDHAAALQHIEAAHSNAPAPTLEGGQVVAPTAPGKPVQGEAPGRFEHLAANVAHGFALTPEGIGATLANAGNDALLGLPGRFGPASLKDYLDQTSDASKQMGGVVGTIAPFVGATKVLGTGGGVLGRFFKGALAGNAVNAALATNKAPEGDRNAAALRAGLNPETALTAGTLNALPAIAEDVRALRNGGHLTGELPDNILSPKSLWKSARSVGVAPKPAPDPVADPTVEPRVAGMMDRFESAAKANAAKPRITPGDLAREFDKAQALKNASGGPNVVDPAPFTPPANLDALPIEKTAEMRPLRPQISEPGLELKANFAEQQAKMIAAERAAQSPAIRAGQTPGISELRKAMARPTTPIESPPAQAASTALKSVPDPYGVETNPVPNERGDYLTYMKQHSALSGLRKGTQMEQPVMDEVQRYIDMAKREPARQMSWLQRAQEMKAAHDAFLTDNPGAENPVVRDLLPYLPRGPRPTP